MLVLFDGQIMLLDIWERELRDDQGDIIRKFLHRENTGFLLYAL